jgi:hypothetical protein
MEELLEELGKIICAYDDLDLRSMERHNREFSYILDKNVNDALNLSEINSRMDIIRQTFMTSVHKDYGKYVSASEVDKKRDKYNLMLK